MTIGISAFTPSYAGFTPRPMGGTAVAPSPAAQAGDSTRIGDLAQALTGRAAALFDHMDAKTRSTLETMVRSGQVTAKDVVIGLDEMAKQAEFSRFIAENPLTDAERVRSAELEAMRSELPFGQASLNSNPRPQSVAREMDSLQQAYGAGRISKEELDKGLETVRAQMQEEIDTRLKPQMERLNTYGAAASEQMNNVLSRKVSEYKAGLADRSSNGVAEEISTEEGRAAADKLYSLGLLSAGPKAVRQAAEAYARQADVAGLGPAGKPAPANMAGAPPPAIDTAPGPSSMTPPNAATAVSTTTSTQPAIPDWAASLLSPKQQAGIELLRQATESDKADKPNEDKAFWAAKYLLSGSDTN